MECKSLRESGDKIRAFDVAYYAASLDDAETNRKFAESLELDYPILSDEDKKVAEAYGVSGGSYAKRHTVYIGKDGKILYVDTGVKVKTAGDDVAARLEKLGVDRAE
jgi:peroxiredoxin Q/BCP